jgi:hypothetical protein
VRSKRQSTALRNRLPASGCVPVPVNPAAEMAVDDVGELGKQRGGQGAAPRSTCDHRRGRARSSPPAPPGHSASRTALIAALPLKHEPPWRVFACAKYAVTDAATATGQSVLIA